MTCFLSKHDGKLYLKTKVDRTVREFPVWKCTPGTTNNFILHLSNEKTGIPFFFSEGDLDEMDENARKCIADVEGWAARLNAMCNPLQPLFHAADKLLQEIQRVEGEQCFINDPALQDAIETYQNLRYHSLQDLDSSAKT